MDYNYQNPYTPKPNLDSRQAYAPPQPQPTYPQQPPYSSPYGQLSPYTRRVGAPRGTFRCNRAPCSVPATDSNPLQRVSWEVEYQPSCRHRRDSAEHSDAPAEHAGRNA